MSFDEIRAAGLGATLSEGEPPPPFFPDEAHYPPVRPGAGFEAALRGGTPRLVDVLRVRADGETTVVTGYEDGDRAAVLTIVLPHGYACTAPGRLSEGRRYVVITSPTAVRSRYDLYMGTGAEHSIMLLDDSGAVETPVGMRDAEELVATARRAS